MFRSRSSNWYRRIVFPVILFLTLSSLALQSVTLTPFPGVDLVSAAALMSGPEDCQAVTWVHKRNVVATGNTIEKTGGGSAWNAGAASSVGIQSGSSGHVEATVASTSHTLMFGLSRIDKDAHWQSLDYAFYIDPAVSGGLTIVERGAGLASYGSYAAGDVLRVAVEGTTVRYYRNGNLLYTSLVAPTFPLYMDSSIWNQGGKVQNAQICGANAPAPLPPSTCEAVTWVHKRNTMSTGNTVEKTAGGSAWNAGAASSQAIQSGNGGYVRATIASANDTLMFGLSHRDSDVNWTSLDYAFYIDPAVGVLSIQEKGTNKASWSMYDTGDELTISVNEAGVVRYYHNNQLVYTSTAAPAYPLYMDSSIWNQGGKVQNAQICGASAHAALPQSPCDSLDGAWTGKRNVSAIGNTITKVSGGSAWNAGGASRKGILSGRGYVQMTVASSSDILMFGLSNSDIDVQWQSIDYAFYIDPNVGSLQIVEKGTNRGGYGLYDAGDTLRVAVDDAQVVRYYKNGELLYTSTVAPKYPLFLDSSLYSSGSKVQEASLCGASLTEPISTSNCQPVTWTGGQNAAPTGNTLVKTAGGSAWNAGAISNAALQPGSTGYVRAMVASTQDILMFGLSDDPSNNVSWQNLDYGFYMDPGLSGLAVVESGSGKGSVSLYDVGDELAIGVGSSGLVRYYRNGVAVYTSTVTAPSAPLYMDSSLYSTGSKVQDAYICNGVPGATPTPTSTSTSTSTPTSTNTATPTATLAAGQPTGWTNLANVVAYSDTITKTTGGPAWDAGASSDMAVRSGSGAVEFTVADLDGEVAVGLSTNDVDPTLNTINFAWRTVASTHEIEVVENGQSRGRFGTYAVGTHLSVSVSDARQVTYYRDGQLVYTSLTQANLPLVLDASIHTAQTRLVGANISGIDLVPYTEQVAPQASDHYRVWGSLSQSVLDGDVIKHNVVVIMSGTEQLLSITDEPGYQSAPSLSGDIVVWEDNSATCFTCERDILGKNLLTGATYTIATGPTDQIVPSIDGTTVTWLEIVSDTYQLMTAEIGGGGLLAVVPPISIALTHNYVQAADKSGAVSRQAKAIRTVSSGARLGKPLISNTYIVWPETQNRGASPSTASSAVTAPSDKNLDSAGYLTVFDRKKGKTFSIEETSRQVSDYDLDGSRLVWVDPRGIWLTDLSNSKSTLLTGRPGSDLFIKDNLVLWASGANEDLDNNGLDIWYLDLTQLPLTARPLINDAANQRHPAVVGDSLMYEDDYPTSVAPGKSGSNLASGEDKRYGRVAVTSLKRAKSGTRSRRSAPKTQPKSTAIPTATSGIKTSGYSGLNSISIYDLASDTPTPVPTVPAFKGIHAPNARGWINNPRKALDVLGADRNRPYFGSVLVLSSDLCLPVDATRGWGATVGEAMAHLTQQGVEVIIRFDDRRPASICTGSDYSNVTHNPKSDGSMSPDVVVNHLSQLLNDSRYSWIEHVQIDNEPNLEWSKSCEGCYWNGSPQAKYTWHNVVGFDDPQLYKALGDFYKEVGTKLRTQFPGKEFWTPPMAASYYHTNISSPPPLDAEGKPELHTGQNLYYYLEAMINAYEFQRPGENFPTKRFTYHAYPYPGGYGRFGLGIRNNTFDWFPTWLQCRVDDHAWWFCPDQANTQTRIMNLQSQLLSWGVADIRSQITELGWDPIMMYPQELKEWQPNSYRWEGHCGHSQTDNFWPAAQPTTAPDPRTSVPPPTLTYCDGYAFDTPSTAPVKADHTFSDRNPAHYGDMEQFILYYSHGAERIHVWTVGGGGSPDPVRADGLDATGTVRAWLSDYQQWLAP